MIFFRLHRWPLRVAAGLFAAATLAVLCAAQDDSAEQRIRRDLAYLASEECEGRGVETKGLEKAAEYIAKQFENAGLKPAGVAGSWYQPFTMSGPGKLGKGSKLVLRGPQGQSIELQEDRDFRVMGYSAAGSVSAPLVFVGYGATAPRIDYDDYNGIDVKGKVVVLLRRVPRYDSKVAPFDGDLKDEHAALVPKLAGAETRKAAAVILVNDRGIDKDELTKFGELATGSGGTIPTFHVKRSVIDRILMSSLGLGLPEIEMQIAGDLKPRSAELKGWSAQLEARVDRKVIPVKNVAGVLQGSGPLAGEIVVVGAHYDHLGRGERGSLAKKDDRNKIHFGADDNASGTTAIMELARRFGGRKDRQGRTIVFLAFSAEEKGLLGSRHYCNKEPLFPLKDTVAMLNLDMVGRMEDDGNTGKRKLLAWGVGTSKEFEAVVDKINGKYGFTLNKVKGGTGPSDHDSFYRKKIPVLFFWTGTHKDYHRPTDTADRINYKDMLRLIDFSEEVLTYLTTTPTRPDYVQVAGGGSVRPVGKMPRMGIMPAYDSEKKGLLVDGVTPGGPAAKAGLKAGDLITAIGDREVTNVESYMAIMRTQKAGQPLMITIQRGKEKLTLKVTPQ